MGSHQKSDLVQMQSLPLGAKLAMTVKRIETWYNAWDGQVYVSFSGGKDSTVLLDIVRCLYSDVLAVFSDTGLEYPEIRAFVKSKENLEIIRPEMNFRQVILEKGYPVVSKEVARAVKYARKTGTKSGDYYMKKFNGELMYNGEPSRYNMENWKFLLDAPFNISSECCEIMKKRPFHKFEREGLSRSSALWPLSQESVIKRGSVQGVTLSRVKVLTPRRSHFGRSKIYSSI